MFQKAKNIDTAFRQMRTLTLVVIGGCLALSAFVVWRSFRQVATLQGKIYILANGKALEAVAGERAANLPVEARDHIATFHRYFFTLDPDEKAIQEGITRALYLADRSARDVYGSLKENNYYTTIISGNISQKLTVDSIWVDTERAPYYFRCWAQQRITRPSTVTTRSLVTEGYLRTVSRSDNNPHGFLIEKWRTLENRDLKTENR